MLDPPGRNVVVMCVLMFWLKGFWGGFVDEFCHKDDRKQEAKDAQDIFLHLIFSICSFVQLFLESKNAIHL